MYCNLSIHPSFSQYTFLFKVTETGPNDEQMIENGGRGVAMMVLQALGGSRRIHSKNHNSQPHVVILVGNNKTGAYGLCAARHLANHECSVTVCVIGNDVELVNVNYKNTFFFPFFFTFLLSLFSRTNFVFFDIFIN